ncbi:hypothetical protein [Vibrio phage LV6]|nr:hypothetical protein [Vibrio phage LV6]
MKVSQVNALREQLEHTLELARLMGSTVALRNTLIRAIDMCHDVRNTHKDQGNSLGYQREVGNLLKHVVFVSSRARQDRLAVEAREHSPLEMAQAKAIEALADASLTTYHATLRD